MNIGDVIRLTLDDHDWTIMDIVNGHYLLKNERGDWAAAEEKDIIDVRAA